MIRLLLVTVFFLVWNHGLLAQADPVFKGRVIDADTKLVLSGANVYIEGSRTGVTSDSDGYFELPVNKKGTKVIIGFLGYRNDTIILNNIPVQFAEIKLMPANVEVEEINISADNNRNVNDVAQGVTRIKGREIQELPSFMGEADPIKALRLTPGVQGSKEGFTGLYIRGGGPDQNLMLLDGTTIYNPSHLYGFFSVFNPDITDEVRLSKSGMDAVYGGRLASVLEVNTRDGNFEKLTTKGSIGLLSSKLTVEGPIVKDHTSFVISGRRTYIHEVLEILKEPLNLKRKTLRYTDYHFFDLNGKIVSKINRNNKLTLSVYEGGDRFNFEGQSFGFNTLMEWGNMAGSLTWDHVVSKDFYVKNTVSFSGYDYDFKGMFMDYVFTLSSYIRDYSFKNCFYVDKGKYFLKYGVEAHSYVLKPTGQTLEHVDFKNDLVAGNVYHSFDVSPFVSSSFDIGRLKTDLGLRVPNYFQTGPVYQWTKTSVSEWEGELMYAKGEIVKYYPGIEPRLALRYLLNSNSSIKFSYTQNNQYVHIAPVSTVSLPTDIWVPSTVDIPPQKGWQLSTGYYADFGKNMYETSVDLYLKRMKSQIEMGTNAVDVYNVSFEDRLLFGTGLSKGFEFYAKKKKGRLTGWFGYTLSYTDRQFDGLNEGRSFYAKYDRRHDLSLVNMYKFNEKWTGSLVFVFATGNAFTIPVYRYLIQGKLVNGYPGINTYRMPDYHRADVSLTRKFNRRKMKGDVNFSIYNLYNHKNPYYIMFNTIGSVEENRLEVRPEVVSLFTFLPSVTFHFEL